ncbi:MAG: ATP-binding cassette domain-containing protein [Candidatus Rokubacteria bacterium]|nr:ATP-binding cassette domain-containing protein [Candidatus Rokubacteria bacterium]
MNGTPALLEVESLVKHFAVGGFAFDRGRLLLRAVDGVSFAIPAGRTLGLVGESGCGKTTTGRLILRLEQPTSGMIGFLGRDVTRLDREGLREYRRSVQAVFQDPYASLDPRMRVGAIIAEPLVVNDRVGSADARARVAELLDLAGLPRRAAELYPHEFSGGQRQRIAIARALSLSPKLVVLDEPVSALDVSIRAQILNLLVELQDRLGVSYLFVAHDLAAVAHLSHEIAVMYLGKIVEIGDAEAVSLRPRHPYTQALFSAALPAHPDDAREDIVLAGEVPNPLRPPSGCAFHPRCPQALPRCSHEAPALRARGGRMLSCHLYDGAEGDDHEAPALRQPSVPAPHPS